MRTKYYHKAVEVSCAINQHGSTDIYKAVQNTDFDRSSVSRWCHTHYDPRRISLLDWAYNVVCQHQFVSPIPRVMLLSGDTPWRDVYELLVKVEERLIKNKRMETIKDETLVDVTML